MHNKSIKSWNADDRPREKLAQKGASALTDVELLAILIGSGNRELSAFEIRRLILKSVDNEFNKLARLTLKDLMSYNGIGLAKAVTISACLEIGRRKNSAKIKEVPSITSSNDVYKLMGAKLKDLDHEVFWVILLNKGMRIITSLQVAKGGVGSVVVDKSIVLRHAIQHLASNIILVHNHPSGSITPSTMDDELTLSLKKGAKLLNINICDHLIIAGNSYFSYLDEGKLA